MVSSDVWDAETAAHYDTDSADMFRDDVLTPTVDFLATLAGAGPVLEFAVGTGRVAIPLTKRGIAVTGIELSPAMVAQLRTKASEADIPVTIGDMSTTTVQGEFTLVYLVWNSISNLRTQAEQVECFKNAARHLAPGGRFVIELWIPPIRRLPPGQTAVPFDISDGHIGFDTYDLVTQQCVSHHYRTDSDGTVRYDNGHFRYIWPAECDLMAQLAGLGLEDRFADWTGAPFTNESDNHVSVWRKP
jgi:SAM-dependent methyltransferase